MAMVLFLVHVAMSTAAIPVGPMAYDADHYVWNSKFDGKVGRPQWVIEPDLSIDPGVLNAVR